MKLEEAEGRCSLVGRFAKDRPPLDYLRTKLKEMLRPKGDLQIGSLNKRCILLRFSLEDDCKRAWMRSQLMVEGSRLWLSRWTSEQHLLPNRDSPMTLVWLQLPLLPIHLFNFELLSRICAPVGRVVALDSATLRRTRPSTAKVRIEIDASKPLYDRIWMEIDGGDGKPAGFWQRIEVERAPQYCVICGRFGHNLARCRRRGGIEGFGDEDQGLAGASERGPPPVCGNVQENSGPGFINKEREACPATACKNVSEEQCRNAAQGLCFDLTLSEQELLVQEAILKAAENIMEEVATKVMKEDCSNPKWADLVEKEDQNGTLGNPEMSIRVQKPGTPGPESGENQKQGSELGNPRSMLKSGNSTEESNRGSSGQGKGLSKNQIRREKRKQSEARKAENKRRGESLDKESPQVSSGLFEPLMELEVWIDKAKEVVSKEEAEVIEKARSEVLQFFRHAQLELGEERFHEKKGELVQKVNRIFLDKLGNTQGDFRNLVKDLGSPMKGEREVTGIESSGSSKIQESSQNMEEIDHRAFVVKKEAWEKAKLEISAHMLNIKKELGMQEFERRKEEIVEKTKALYLEKLKELSETP